VADIKEVIEKWRAGLEKDVLPHDPDEKINGWLADLNAAVLSGGFTADDLEEELGDDPRSYVASAYIQVHGMSAASRLPGEGFTR
jgi:hypothetical protein